MLTGDDVRRAFLKHLGERGLLLIEPFDPFLRQMNQPRLPTPHESAAIAPYNSKTAALCFDRVWAGLNSDVPDAIAFRGTSSAETVLIFGTLLAFAIQSMPSDVAERRELFAAMSEPLKDIVADVPLPEHPTIEEYTKILADGVGREYGTPAVCVYASRAQRDRQYQLGDRGAIVALLENLPLVDEEQLQWQQVLDLRRDKQMLAKFRRFAHWVDTNMIGKPLSFIEDEVAARLHAYAEAVRVHGPATRIGALQITLDSAVLGGGAAALAKLVVDTGVPGALIAGAAAAASGAALRLASVLLNLRSQRANAAGELTYVVELSEQMKAG